MAEVRVNFQSNTAGFQRGIAAVRSGIAGLASVAATVVAPLAALGAAIGAIGLSTKAIRLAAEMEGMETGMATMLGSAKDAKKVIEDISKLAASTPFGLTDLVQAARSLLSVTGKDELISTLSRLGDVSASAQKPLTEVASMYAKIVGSGTLGADDLNQIADALGGQALQEFARVLGVDGIAAVRKLGSEGKITGEHLQQVFINLTQKGGMAFQAMQAQAVTFNGLISTLEDSWDGLLRAWGKPVMLAVKPLLTDATTLLESLQNKAAAFGEATARAITFLRKAFKGGEIVSLASSGLILAAQSFVNVIVRGMMAAGEVILNAFVAAGSLIGGVFSNGAMWDMLHAQFDLVGLAIQKAILEAIPDNWLKNKSPALANIDTLMESRGNAADNYGSGAARKNAELFAKAGQSLRESGTIFSDAFKNGKGIFETGGRLKQLQNRWNALSRPDTAPPAAAEEAGPAMRPKASSGPQAAAAAAHFEPILSSLQRIGGASALTNNPLVSLQQTANNYLQTIAKNSTRPAVAVLA